MSPLEPIAMIGIGCRLPGGVRSADDLWELLVNGVDAITETPQSRWRLQAKFHSDPARPGRIASRFGGFIDGVDRFDAQFFGISPREAAAADPQQRVLLEVAYAAAEDAGLTMTALSGQRARDDRLLYQPRRVALRRRESHLLLLQPHRPERRRRHRLLVGARGNTPGLPQPVEWRDRAGVRGRRQPDPATDRQHRLLKGSDALAGRPLQELRRARQRLRAR
jgi:hypothetical protein